MNFIEDFSQALFLFYHKYPCLSIKKRIQKAPHKNVRNLASIRGFEPPTCRLGGGCSILLSYIDVSRPKHGRILLLSFIRKDLFFFLFRRELFLRSALRPWALPCLFLQGNPPQAPLYARSFQHRGHVQRPKRTSF